MSRFEKRFADVVNTSGMSEEDIYLAQVYYYGLVAWIDTQVGFVLDDLRRSGLLEKTIIVFGADHGASLGEGGCYAKHIFAPQSHRVPLMISWPERLPSGIVDESICANIDLARTLFALAGIDAPEQFKGRNLFGSHSADAVYSTIGYGYRSSNTFPNRSNGGYFDGHGWPRRSCIRTSQYRLDKNVRIDGRYVGSEDEDLFFTDVRRDPGETTNMADWPEYTAVVSELSAKLDQHLKGAAEPEEDMLIL